MTTQSVTVHGHTKTVGGKLVWVPTHQRNMEVSLEEHFSGLFPKPTAPKAEPKPATFTPKTAEATSTWTGHNTQPGHNKVYKTAVFKGPDGKAYIVSQFGKQGGALKQVVHFYPNHASAQKDFVALVAAKQKKGYGQASSAVAKQAEAQPWEPVQGMGSATPQVPAPAAPAPKPASPMAIPAGVAADFAAIFGAPAKVPEKQSAPAPKPSGAPAAGDGPLAEKAKMQGGGIVTYGDPKGTAAYASFKMSGMKAEMRVMITGPKAKEAGEALAQIGAKWMPNNKVWALTLPGKPWASGKRKAHQLHNTLIAAVGGPGAVTAAGQEKPAFPAGVKVGFNSVQPGMKFKMATGTSGSTWTIHDVGPRGIYLNKKEAQGAEMTPVWVPEIMWKENYQEAIVLAEPFTGKVLQVGDTKVENGKTYKLNANHKWELVEEVPKVDGPAIMAALNKTGGVVGKTQLPNGFWIGTGTASGLQTLRIYTDGMSEAMKQALLNQGFKLNKDYYWKTIGGGALIPAAAAGLMKDFPHTGGGTVQAAPVPKPEPTKPEPTPEVFIPKAPAAFPFKQIGPQKGSNPGGLYEDNLGKKWYIKFPESEDHAKNELLASKLYKLAGAQAPKLKLVNKDGKVGIASLWQEGLTSDAKGVAKAPGAMEGFIADAWLGNWDVAGMGFDNILKTAEGGAVRIDVGGSLLYRAQGGAKGAAFGNTVSELESLRDAATNPQTAQLFKGITKEQMNQGAIAVLEIPDSVIAEAVSKFGPGGAAEKNALTEKLLARKAYLAAKFPAANAIANPPKPDPAKLPVDPAKLPALPDFLNWNGTGKGLSSNADINAQNQAAAGSIYAVAKAGNLTALQNMTFMPVGGTTPKSMADHPSQHVRAIYETASAILEGIANPSATKQKAWVVEEDISDASELAEAFPSRHYGVSVGKVPPSERLGQWISLGTVAGAHAIVPQKTFNVTEANKAQGKKDTQKMPPNLRAFMKDVKSSGSANNPYREGAEYDHSGNKCRDVVRAAYDHATEFEEGAILRRQQAAPQDMINLLLKAPVGHIFQNPGSMCTSLNPDWHWGGAIDLEIVCAKGSKALYNIGVGAYNHEGEITTLPGQRFMIAESKAKGPKGAPWFKLLMLPPDPAYADNLLTAKGAAA